MHTSITSVLLVLLLAGSTDWLGFAARVCRSGDEVPASIPVEEECESAEETRLDEAPAWEFIFPVSEPVCFVCLRSTENSVAGDKLHHTTSSADAIRGSPAC